MSIGIRLRERRQALGLSLQDVSDRARISVATLSRIENEKQSLEMGLFLVLAKLLDSPPEVFLDTGIRSSDGLDPLVKKISLLNQAQRTRLWRRIAVETRANHARNGAPRNRQMARDVEEFLAQLEMLRTEIESVRKQLRSR